MKSKRAKEFIIQYGVPPSPTAAFNTLPATTGAALVELAEEDARDRARKVFIKACPMRGASTDCIDCSEDRECRSVKEFLKYYDNEQ